jgi:hypothetical protein
VVVTAGGKAKAELSANERQASKKAAVLRLRLSMKGNAGQALVLMNSAIFGEMISRQRRPEKIP